MGDANHAAELRTSSSGLFHCGRCGSFFKAPFGATATRRCPDCGADPSLALDDRRIRKVTADGTVLRDVAGGIDDPTEEDARRSAKHGRRRRKANRMLVIGGVFLVGWIVLLGAFAIWMTAKNQQRERAELARAAIYKATRAQLGNPLSIDLDPIQRALLQDALPSCQQALTGFLQSRTPESRSQWVHKPLETLGLISSFDQSAAAYDHEIMPSREFIGLLNTPDGLLIESLWTAPDGRRIEAVFRRGDEGWRLDWESFVRYSEMPWVMFLAGGGRAEQEFRLLARERLAEERRHEPNLSIVLHPPRFGEPSAVGPASPEFSVPRLSPAGKALDALFTLKRDGLAPFDARVPSQDPESMIRVRLLVSRSDDEASSRRFEIKQVLAGHWLGINDPGIPVPPATDDP